MIDLHCHILPGADDGPAILAESLSMAKQAVADGIHTIVATPHALGGAHPNPPEKVITDVKSFQSQLHAENISLTVYPGCEVHNCPDMANRIRAGEATFLNTAHKHILVEFPFKSVSKEYTAEVAKLLEYGITPILAHPERNPLSYNKPTVLYDFISMGCLIQMNSTSITGGFGETIQACANNLIRHKMVHIIASDAHSAGHRAPVLSVAVKFAAEALESHEEALKMVTELPQQILDGKDIIVPDAISPKNRKIFS